MLDCVIANGTLIDGSGRPGVRADVGLRDGRIVAIGVIDEPTRATIDAEGLAVAPGFIDLHTHYDAQVFWDPCLSPSTLHGITTVIGGNCGFSIAPVAGAQADYLRRLLACVEGMPLEALESAVPWGRWQDFGQFLGALDGSVGPNVGFLAGHTAIRRVAMGEASGETQASAQQLATMEALLADALGAGALGFSSSNGSNHVDGDGAPVPSRRAGDDEMLRLCGVAGRFPGTTLEYIPSDVVAESARMTAMSLAADRPLNWNVLVIASDRNAVVEAQLAVADQAAARGGRIVALANPAPLVARRSFLTAFGLNTLPGWAEVLKLPVPARIAALADPRIRAQLREGVARAGASQARLTEFGTWTVEDTVAPENLPFAGLRIDAIARERGRDALDTLLDMVVADGLRTTLTPPQLGGDAESWQLRARLWRDPRVVLGASDAGAHLDTLSLFSYPVDLLGTAVRERGLLELAEAVHLLTERPAQLYGLKGRGRIAAGNAADLVIFDPATIGPGPATTRLDLPMGAPRMYAEPRGIHRVIVNGTTLVEHGRYSGRLPGAVLRSGRDTCTVKARP